MSGPALVAVDGLSLETHHAEHELDQDVRPAALGRPTGDDGLFAPEEVSQRLDAETAVYVHVTRLGTVGSHEHGLLEVEADAGPLDELPRDQARRAHADGEAVLLGSVVHVVEGQDAACAGIVPDDHGRVSRDEPRQMPSHQARVQVHAGPGGEPDEDIEFLVFVVGVVYGGRRVRRQKEEKEYQGDRLPELLGRWCCSHNALLFVR